MTPELTKQIEQEAEAFSKSHPILLVEEAWAKCASYVGASKYAARVEELEREVERLNSIIIADYLDEQAPDPSVLAEALERIANRPEPAKGQREGDAWVSVVRDIAKTALNKHNSSIQ